MLHESLEAMSFFYKPTSPWRVGEFCDSLTDLDVELLVAAKNYFWRIFLFFFNSVLTCDVLCLFTTSLKAEK